MKLIFSASFIQSPAIVIPTIRYGLEGVFKRVFKEELHLKLAELHIMPISITLVTENDELISKLEPDVEDLAKNMKIMFVSKQAKIEWNLTKIDGEKIIYDKKIGA